MWIWIETKIGQALGATFKLETVAYLFFKIDVLDLDGLRHCCVQEYFWF